MSKVQTDKECKLRKEDCDKIEDLRISLWNNTHEIEKNANKLVENIDRLSGMILGTKQDPNYMKYLMDVRRTGTFLESSSRKIDRLEKTRPESLFDQKGKEYRKIGYFNNIIGNIKANCGCPGSFIAEKTTENKLTKFTLFKKK